MKKKFTSMLVVLLAATLLLSLAAAVLAEDDEGEEKVSESGSWTNTITNPAEESQNVIQNVNVNVEVEVEGGGGEGQSSGSGSRAGAVQNPETLLRYCEVTGSAITSHDWVYLYAESSIHSKILETLKTREKPVEVIGRAENSKHQIWYKVKTASGRIGYIRDKYLLFDDPNGPCTTNALLPGGTDGEATPCPDAETILKQSRVEDILPAGVTVEVTYVPEVVYVCVPTVTYVPRVIYTTPAPENTPAPETAQAPEETPAP